MKKIIYYISEYGFGHATRSIAIIRELLRNPEIHIEVVNEFALGFIRRSVLHKNVSYYSFSSDIGYILKDGSIEPNPKRQIHELNCFTNNLDKLVNSEVKRLSKYKVDLIISDISPIAFQVADRLGVPSIGISNFTWFTAFEGLVPSEYLYPLKEAYKKMDYYYALAGSNEVKWGRKENFHFDFYSRKVDQEEVKRIRSNLAREKKLVFIGFGMKMKIHDLQKLQIWNSPDTNFIVSSNLQIDHPNVFKIPHDYLETQNYIAACNLVITKAGWGTVGEAVFAGIPLLIIERDGMKEDENTIQYLKASNRAKTISWNNFKKYIYDSKSIGVNNIKCPDTLSFDNMIKKIDEILGIKGNIGRTTYLE